MNGWYHQGQKVIVRKPGSPYDGLTGYVSCFYGPEMINHYHVAMAEGESRGWNVPLAHQDLERAA